MLGYPFLDVSPVKVSGRHRLAAARILGQSRRKLRTASIFGSFRRTSLARPSGSSHSFLILTSYLSRGIAIAAGVCQTHIDHERRELCRTPLAADSRQMKTEDQLEAGDCLWLGCHNHRRDYLQRA